MVPCILTCSFKWKKNFNILSEPGPRNLGHKMSYFLTLVGFISLSNYIVSSWKFYHSLLTSAPTYTPNLSPFECTWAEIDFWGGGGGGGLKALKNTSIEYRYYSNSEIKTNSSVFKLKGASYPIFITYLFKWWLL